MNQPTKDRIKKFYSYRNLTLQSIGVKNSSEISENIIGSFSELKTDLDNQLDNERYNDKTILERLQKFKNGTITLMDHAIKNAAKANSNLLTIFEKKGAPKALGTDAELRAILLARKVKITEIHGNAEIANAIASSPAGSYVFSETYALAKQESFKLNLGDEFQAYEHAVADKDLISRYEQTIGTWSSEFDRSIGMELKKIADSKPKYPQHQTHAIQPQYG